MYTYVQRPGCKKENMATYVYIRAGSRTPTRAYVRRGLVFMGRQRNASCSWGGNVMRRVHREATKRVGANRLGRNGMRGHVHREGWTEQEMKTRPGVPQNGGNGPPTIETGVLLIGRGVRTAKRTKRTSYGRNGGPVDREGCGVPRNGRNGLVLERYGRNGGPVHREGCDVPQNGTPRDNVHLHRRPPPASTVYRRPPPASTSSCSSSLHRALLHRLLFNHLSTVYCSSSTPPSTVHPALHTTGSCSTTPPWAPLHRLLFIQPSTPRGPVHPEATPSL
ncbi:hypothetical protein CFC21_044977, partial [Triticum aestivum]